MPICSVVGTLPMCVQHVRERPFSHCCLLPFRVPGTHAVCRVPKAFRHSRSIWKPEHGPRAGREEGIKTPWTPSALYWQYNCILTWIFQKKSDGFKKWKLQSPIPKKKKKNLKKNSGNEWNNLCHLYQFEFSMATSGADTETVVDIACQ